MNKLILALVAGALAFGAGSTLAQAPAKAAADPARAPEGNTTQVTKEDQAKLKAEREAKKASAASMTPEQKAAAKKANQSTATQAMKAETNTSTLSKEDQAKLKAERAAKKESNAA